MRNGWNGLAGAMRGALMSGWLMTAGAASALAQGEPSGGLGPGAAGGSSPWADIAIYGVGGLVVIALILGVGALIYYSTRRIPEIEGIYLEPAVLGSRFEQLLSEIQGLTLRVQGGESKGYYRKIERLVRIFLERIGYAEARQISDDEVAALLASGEIQQDIAAALRSVFDRAQQGAIHETRKLDFSATELLKDLRAIVKQVEKSPARH